MLHAASGGVISVSGTTVTTVASSSQCPYPEGVSYDAVHGVVYAACDDGGVISVRRHDGDDDRVVVAVSQVRGCVVRQRARSGVCCMLRLAASSV